MAKSLGVGRLLIAVYGVFALSASARALFQIITKFDEAPLAYSLSALAASVYLIATVTMAKESLRRYAAFAIWFELVGVLVVGAASFLLPSEFSHPSVWSGFGIGYGFIPLVLPLLGLFWLRYQRARDK